VDNPVDYVISTEALEQELAAFHVTHDDVYQCFKKIKAKILFNAPIKLTLLENLKRTNQYYRN
jgi:hypothetical protein